MTQTVDLLVTRTNPDGSLVTVHAGSHDSSTNSGGGTSTGTIVGSVVGSVAGVAVLAVLVLMFITRKKKKSLIDVLTGHTKSNSELGADTPPFSDYHNDNHSPPESYSGYRGWSATPGAALVDDTSSSVPPSSSGGVPGSAAVSRSASGVYRSGSQNSNADYSYYRQPRTAPANETMTQIESLPENPQYDVPFEYAQSIPDSPPRGRFTEQDDSPDEDFDFGVHPSESQTSQVASSENSRNLPINSLMHQYERVHGIGPEDDVPMDGLPIPLGYYETVMEEDETPHPVYAQPKAAPSRESRFTETGSL